MNFQDIKQNFQKGYWNTALVKMAVKKGIITEEQYKEITGIEYPKTK